MKIPTVVKCCCCGIEVGTIVIGILSILGDISGLGTCISYLTTDHVPLPPKPDSTDFDPRQYWTKETIITQLIYVIFHLIVDALLLYAVFKHNAKYMLPFMILSGIGLVIVICVAIIGSIMMLIVGASTSAGAFFLFLFIILIIALILCLFIYMWIVVYSHYVVLKEENSRGQYDKQPYRAT